jgi:hypothetical protein
MKMIPDLAARLTALTAVDRTLLVEAGPDPERPR